MFLGLILIIWGGLWLAQDLGYIPADVHFFWPVVLIAIGLAIIFNRKTGRGCCDFWYIEGKEKKDK